MVVDALGDRRFGLYEEEETGTLEAKGESAVIRRKDEDILRDHETLGVEVSATGKDAVDTGDGSEDGKEEP